jgi:methylated-DNA-protein-cysteine methyltransferase-like protein
VPETGFQESVDSYLSNPIAADQGASEIADQGFFQQVYELVRQVPEGRVVTYGQIAAALDNPRRARMVGWAMRACPEDVPWHRVVNAKGGLSTRPPSGSFHPQRAFLQDEGVQFDHNGRIDLSIYGWDEFKP